VQKVVVSEAGASVYSASEYASQEFPELDVSLRGAVSIARRLQDPLAELVKIEPKSIGVGQYQHDVNPSDLARSLDAVVEDCVNAVGVDLNTASVPLLAREAQGAFVSRAQLREVSGLGPKTFEQCAGFLRIRDGNEPLDATGVHPESYAVAQAVIAHTKKSVREVMGQSELLRGLKPALFVTQAVGEPTVRDILAELEKPGRDPRGEFKVARFNEGVHDIKDLQPGMLLEGTVSNVAAFGAFVDLGVHQDGLIHVSQLANKFVSDAREVVKTGQVVRVKVLEVDLARKRIALSMKLDAAPVPRPGGRQEARDRPSRPDPRFMGRSAAPAAHSAMAEAFARVKK
jgi:protein Tex